MNKKEDTLKNIIIFLYLYIQISMIVFMGGTTRMYVDHLRGKDNEKEEPLVVFLTP